MLETAPMPTESVEDAGMRISGHSVRRFRVPDEVGVIVALAVLVGFVGAFEPRFLYSSNLVNLVASSAFFGVIALAMVYLLALGEVDLSIGWAFNFSAVIATKAMIAGAPPWLAALAGIAFGAALGLFNGVLVVALGLPAIIVTLGTVSVFQGLALVVSDSAAVLPPSTDGVLFDVMRGSLLGLPTPAVVLVALTIALHVVLHYTRFGYRVQAIGANPVAARLAGLPIARVKVLTLMLVGASAGFSGVMFIGARGAIDPTTGGEFMLAVIAAVVIGGTPLFGGYGTVVGALFGVLIIATISSGIVFFGVDARWSTFVTGAVILIAVAVDRLVRTQRSKRVHA